MVTPNPAKYVWVYLMIPLIAIAGPVIAGFASRSGTSTGGLASALSTEHLQWGNEAPFAAKINADATEDFVGRYHVLGGSGDKTLEYVGGYDGATLKRVWQAGPFGDQSDTRGLHMVVVGNNVLVTDQKSVGHILDATTGKETASITLSDRADSICVEPTGKPEAWIKVPRSTRRISARRSSSPRARSRSSSAKNHRARRCRRQSGGIRKRNAFRGSGRSRKVNRRK
ncbi:MAG: hypothetical protein ACRELY_20305 [Polyangiaceae bacterium]